MKRLVLIFGSAAGVISVVISVMDITIDDSLANPLGYDFLTFWRGPTESLVKTLGLEGYVLIWDSLEIGLNTVLSFAAGALVGLLVHVSRPSCSQDGIGGAPLMVALGTGCMRMAMLKVGTLFAAVASIVTFVVTATATWDFGVDQHSSFARFDFWFGMNVVGPSVVVGRALSVREGANGWLWDSMAVALNALAYFASGVLVGAVLHLASRWLPKNRRYRSVLGWALALGPITVLWVVVLSIFPAGAFGAFLSSRFMPFAGCLLLLVALSLILFCLIRFRPFWPVSDAEPCVPTSGGPATPSSNSGVTEGPPSVS